MQIENSLQILDKIEVENGVLSFSSKDLLGRTVTELKEIGNIEKEVKLSEFYKKGFMPLFPHFSENDIRKLQEFSNRKKEKLQKVITFKSNLKPSIQARTIPTEIDEDGELVEEFDDDLISDDEFASILNDKREVIIADILYKYTYSGMFSVHKNDKTLLDNYIQENNIEYLMPEVSTLTRGVVKPTAKITQSLPTRQQMLYPPDDCGSLASATPSYIDTNGNFVEGTHISPFIRSSCFSIGNNNNRNSNNTSSNNPETPSHTDNLVDLSNNLGACNTLTGFLNSGFGVLGVSRK